MLFVVAAGSSTLTCNGALSDRVVVAVSAFGSPFRATPRAIGRERFGSEDVNECSCVGQQPTMTSGADAGAQLLRRDALDIASHDTAARSAAVRRAHRRPEVNTPSMILNRAAPFRPPSRNQLPDEHHPARIVAPRHRPGRILLCCPPWRQYVGNAHSVERGERASRSAAARP